MAKEEVTEALRACEIRLRQSLGEAAQTGDYDSVLEITKIITSIVALIPNGSSTPSKPKASVTPKRKRRPKYPRFSRRGHDLVKTGWSKKEKKTYEHRAAKKVVDALADALLNAGKNNELMATDALFPLYVADEEVPAYQAYLCLAWLRDIEFLIADGRKGYRLNGKYGDRSAVESNWGKLPEG